MNDQIRRLTRLAVIVGVLVMEGFDPGSVFPTYRRV